MLPVKHIWSGFGQDDKEHYRNQSPISLAWGLTVWKAQMAITTKLGYELGTKEPEAGLTYVALSRMTNIENLFIGGGCSLARLTTTIRNNKKLKYRLDEDQRLLIASTDTIAYFFPLTI